MNDAILVKGLVLNMVLGIEEWERESPQDVLVDYRIEVDLSRVGETDLMEDTLNYRTVNKSLLSLADEPEVYTIERLASLIARKILSFDRALATTVRITKSGALRHAESVAVEIVRQK
ncbi:dihydroneopterin aldolase [bacterium]|nr:dihydroneopterin aldolase [bacterium]